MISKSIINQPCSVNFTGENDDKPVDLLGDFQWILP